MQMMIGRFPLFLVAKWILVRVTAQDIVLILYPTARETVEESAD
jgi:hypothetical protein